MNKMGVDTLFILTCLLINNAMTAKDKASYDKLAAKINDITEKIEMLIGKVTALDGKVTVLDSKVSRLDGKVTGLNGKMDILNGNVTGLDGKVTGLDGKVTGLNGKMDILNGNVTGLDGKVTGLDGKVTGLDGTVTRLNGKIDGLNGNVTALVGNVAGLDGKVNGLVGKTVGLDSKLDGLDVKVAGVQSTCASGKTSNQIWYQTLSDQLLSVNHSMKYQIDTLQSSCANLSNIQTLTNKSSKQTTPSIDCTELLKKGTTTSGVYTIYPEGIPGGVRLVCDMETDGGGWTLIQRRDAATDFYKTYGEYEAGFGNIELTGNFWLGNKYIHAITRQGLYSLRIDLRGDAASNFEKRAALYKDFSVGDASSSYKLSVGTYSYDHAYADPGDSLSYHNGMKFSAKDVDNDIYTLNCAQLYTGAWWYDSCFHSSLNGDWGSGSIGKGIIWFHFLGNYRSMTFTRMMIRR